MGRISGRSFLMCAAGIAALAAAGCGPIRMESSYRHDPVTIDGSEVDWKDNLAFVEDLRSYVGLRNDDQYLYVCFITQDRATSRLLLGAGLTLWFDPTGGKQHHLGIHFPMGMRELALTRAGRRGGGDEAGGGGEGDQGGRRPRGGDRDAEGGGRDEGGVSSKLMAEALKDMEILGPSQFDRRKLEVAKAPGIEVAVGNPNGAMVYEMKIPLAPGDSTAPFGVGVKPGESFSLGVESGELPSTGGGMRRGEGEGEGGEGGGRGGFGGGYGGRGRGGFGGGGGRGGYGGGGYGGGQGAQRPDPINEWVNIKLATTAEAPSSK